MLTPESLNTDFTFISLPFLVVGKVVWLSSGIIAIKPCIQFNSQFFATAF